MNQKVSVSYLKRRIPAVSCSSYLFYLLSNRIERIVSGHILNIMKNMEQPLSIGVLGNALSQEFY